MVDQNGPTTDKVLLSEETVAVEKRDVRTGKVQVRTITDQVEEVVRASLQGEQIDITRVPIDREVNAAPPVRTEGDVTIVPVLEEILVVEKRLVLKEEIHLTRRVTTDTAEMPLTLRRQRAVVERVDAAGPTSASEDHLSEKGPA